METNKNLWLIPTSPNDETAKGIWIKETRNWCHIYITNSEEIKEGDWCYDEERNLVFQFNSSTGLKLYKESNQKFLREIILTTDPDLIKDGVQAIDYEFLQWFVKNPSCEEVKVESFVNGNVQKIYEIIIPKEEQKQHLIDIMKADEELGLYEEPKQTDENGKPLTYWGGLAEHKQETLEEVYLNHLIDEISKGFLLDKKSAKEVVIKFSKWQQEQDKNKYSEEEFRNKLYECLGYFAYKHNIKINGTELDSWCYENLKK